jgi:hypothetical protein
MSRLSKSWLVFVCGLAASACASAEDVARDRASEEFGCARDKVRLVWLGYDGDATIFKVNACGKETRYVCDEGSETCASSSAK